MNDINNINSMNNIDPIKRLQQQQKQIEKYGKAIVHIKDDEVTIVGHVNSPGMREALHCLREDICKCGCESCEQGLHAECESDGQSCYPNGKHRINDGIHMNKIVQYEQRKIE